MNIRAVICDIYNTLLEVGPGPADAETRWKHQWQRLGARVPPLSLPAFNAESEQMISGIRAEAQKQGIAFPEVYWPTIAQIVFPKLASLTDSELDDFLYAHAQLQRSVRLAAGAADVLRKIVRQQIILGLCSNCQPYTLRELADALSAAGLSSEIFSRRLCFYSFAVGFSKPDPQVFRGMERALAKLGIAANEALMVGDHLDNDILPARAQGWQTWHLAHDTTEKFGGDWPELGQAIFPATPQ